MEKNKNKSILIIILISIIIVLLFVSGYFIINKNLTKNKENTNKSTTTTTTISTTTTTKIERVDTKPIIQNSTYDYKTNFSYSSNIKGKYNNFLKNLKKSINENFEEYTNYILYGSSDYLGTGYEFTLTKDNKILFNTYDKKYNNYTLATDALNMFLIQEGNGRYYYLYFINEGGNLFKFCIDCLEYQNPTITKENVNYIVSVKQGLFDFEYGETSFIFIDIDGNIITDSTYDSTKNNGIGKYKNNNITIKNSSYNYEKKLIYSNNIKNDYNTFISNINTNTKNKFGNNGGIYLTGKSMYLNTSYSLVLANNQILFSTNDNKYNNYVISENVLNISLVETGNGGYKTLYFIKNDGNLYSFCIDCIAENNILIEKENVSYIVDVIEGAIDYEFSGANGPIYIDLDGNIIM